MANTLNAFRGGAVGFIDWLDLISVCTAILYGRPRPREFRARAAHGLWHHDTRYSYLYRAYHKFHPTCNAGVQCIADRLERAAHLSDAPIAGAPQQELPRCNTDERCTAPCDCET